MVHLGDIWTFALDQRLFGQQVINTFALKLTNEPVAPTDETTFINAMWRGAEAYFNLPLHLRMAIRDLQTNQVTHARWLVQRSNPVPTGVVEVEIDENEIGVAAGDAESANIAMSVSRRGLLLSRREKGRIAIAGIPTSGYAAGVFTAPTLLLGGAVAINLIGDDVHDGLYNFQMGFYSPPYTRTENGVVTAYAAKFTHAVAAQARNTVRVQRSRTVGVGS